MDIDERKRFWNTLLLAKDENDRETLGKLLKIPLRLYRYRPVNNNSLEALKTNRLFFSSSNYYDDPFDTFIRIDFKKVREIVRQLNGNEAGLNDAYNILKEVRKNMRENMWSVCFSENSLNESLWLKYADNYTGFVLEYNVEDISKAIFNVYSPIQCEPVKKCMNVDMRDSLLPMYYSDEPYDATDYAGFLAKCYLLEKEGKIQEIKALLDTGVFKWEAERILLIKKFLHHYDEEWRLLLNTKYKIISGLKPYKECVPSKIILGLNMNEDNELLVIRKAKQAGIDSVEKMIIDENDELNTVKVL